MSLVLPQKCSAWPWSSLILASTPGLALYLGLCPVVSPWTCLVITGPDPDLWIDFLAGPGTCLITVIWVVIWVLGWYWLLSLGLLCLGTVCGPWLVRPLPC